MDFVSPIITPVVESLLVPIKRHLGFLVSSSNYVKVMRAKVTQLDGTAHDIHTRQVSNEANRRGIPNRVPDWLEEVKEIKIRSDKVQVDGVGCCNLKRRYKAGKDAYDILKYIESHMNENDKMVWLNEIRPLSEVSTSRPPPRINEDDNNKSRIESRDLIFNKALKSLESNDTKTQKLALCGMGGVGKTTMMEELKKAAKNKKMFDHIVLVVIGQNPNIILIQNTIAEYLGEALIETNKDTRAESLRIRFEGIAEGGKKKILVILDDVWDYFNLKYIGLPSPLPNGFKILLTSREETVCTNMDVESGSIFRISVLEEQEARKLFWDTASFSINDPDMFWIGEEIIRRCGGLPMAITTIASTLKYNQEKDDWKDALFRIQNQEFPVLVNIFEFSYRNLKEDGLKATFLLSGLFPEDYNIYIQDLVMYGLGLKFFKNVHNIEIARSRVISCVNKLMHSNLLIKSDHEGCVKMHDLVRSFVLSKFSKVKQALLVNENSNVFDTLTEEDSHERILLMREGIFDFPTNFSHQDLPSLKLMDTNELLKFPEDKNIRMKKLEVVVYERMHPPLLPQYSTNLRALCLRSCSFVDNDISFLGDLITLEILSLADSDIEMLPSKLGKLKRLKLLDLTGCKGVRIADGVFQNLEKLEELYIGFVGLDPIRLTDANCDELKKLSTKLSTLELEFFMNKANPVDVSFVSLERFKISVGCQLGKNVHGLNNTLMLEAKSCSELLKCKINELFRKADILHLKVNDMSYLEDILPHPPHISLCNIKELRISNCADLTHLFTIPMAKALEKLEELSIVSCHVMKSVVNCENIEAEVIIFRKLKILYLEYLPELVGFGDHFITIQFPELVELKLCGLLSISYIFTEKNIHNASTKQPLFSNQVVFPKLEEMTIEEMTNLKEVWPCEINDNTETMLRQIFVFWCNSLVNVFPSNPTKLLSHLERLEVANCDSVEVLFNIDLGKIKQLSKDMTNLRSIEVTSCGDLREVWRIKDAHENKHLIIRDFQALESITIVWCKRFRNLVTPDTVNFDLRAVKYIKLDGCGEYGERKNELVKNSQEQKQKINCMSREGISKVSDNMSRFAFSSNYIRCCGGYSDRNKDLNNRMLKQRILNVGDNMFVVAFSSYQIIHHFHHLSNIDFHRLNAVEVVFEIEHPINTDQPLTTPQQQPVPLLPYLESLRLERMETLSHVWKCTNWNEFFIRYKQQPQTSFQSLTTMTLCDCKSIKYLFSPLMVKLLSNLKHIVIDRCHCMEEVVSNRDDEEDELMVTSTHAPTTLFWHLDVLELSFMDNLKHIGGGVAKVTTNASQTQSKFSQVNVVYWSLCQYFAKIQIIGCHALLIVIPYYVQGQPQKIESLSIINCKSLREVFETKEINNKNSRGSTSSNIVTTPRPTNSIGHKFPNLKILVVAGCECLENIFTFSTLESLKKLHTLKITDCDAMKVIVSEKYGDASSEDVVFSHLKSIELKCLPNLKGFFLGMNIINFQWPLLEHVIIQDCPQMMVLTSGRSTAPNLKFIHTDLGKHSVQAFGINVTPTMLHQTPNFDPISSLKQYTQREAGGSRSFKYLVEMNMKGSNHAKIFPWNVLQQLQNLETVYTLKCNYADEVFEVASEVTNNDTQTVIKFSKLREVELDGMLRLKYIWKNNRRTILEFPNLTKLSIGGSRALEYVFTRSMVGSIQQLQELKIFQCWCLKVIVKEDDKEYNYSVGGIKFPCLKYLELGYYLPCIKGLFLGNEDVTMPSIETLQIVECPRLEVFTKGRLIAPMLTVVTINGKSFDVKEDMINSLIMKKKQEGFRFERHIPISEDNESVGEEARTMNLFERMMNLL